MIPRRKPATQRKKALKPILDINPSLLEYNEGSEVVRPIIRDKDKPEMMRRATHLTEQLSPYHQQKAEQGELWDTLLPDVQQKAIQEGVTVQMVNSKGVGIIGSSTERKVFDCLCLKLHEKSQNKNPEERDFYRGNHKAEDDVFANMGVDVPFLYVTMFEVAKAFNGGKNPGGDVIKTVYKTLKSLANDVDKKAVIQYKRRVDIKGKTGSLKIQDVANLIKMPEAEITMDSGEKTNQTLIALHPIFRDQIEKYYTQLPVDIISRMIDAAGNRKMTEATFILREYLVSQQAFKKTEWELGQMKLFRMLNKKYMDNWKGAEVKKQFEEAAEVMKKIGLLESYRYTKGVGGVELISFKLFSDGWQKMPKKLD